MADSKIAITPADEINAQEDQLYELMRPALEQYEKNTGLRITQIDVEHDSGGCLERIDVSFFAPRA